MTSRDGSRTRLQDQLDVKISWVLRVSVADVRPHPRVWPRIVERLGEGTTLGRARYWQGFWFVCRGLAMWLLDAAVEPPAEFAYCYSLGPRHRRDRDYLRLLMYHCDLPMPLIQAM